MLKTYSLYGLNVVNDLQFPFLTPLKNCSNPDIIVKRNDELLLNSNIDPYSTLNDLNIKTGNIENRYYKCKISNGSLIEYKLKDNNDNIALLINSCICHSHSLCSREVTSPTCNEFFIKKFKNKKYQLALAGLGSHL